MISNVVWCQTPTISLLKATYDSVTNSYTIDATIDFPEPAAGVVLQVTVDPTVTILQIDTFIATAMGAEFQEFDEQTQPFQLFRMVGVGTDVVVYQNQVRVVFTMQTDVCVANMNIVAGGVNVLSKDLGVCYCDVSASVVAVDTILEAVTISVQVAATTTPQDFLFLFNGPVTVTCADCASVNYSFQNGIQPFQVATFVAPTGGTLVIESTIPNTVPNAVFISYCGGQQQYLWYLE